MSDEDDLPDKPVFSAKFWHHLAALDPTGSGPSARDAQDWFEVVWPLMQFGGPNGEPYKDFKRATTSWWMRTTDADMVKARTRGNRIRDRKETESMEKRAIERMKEPAPPARKLPQLKIIQAG